MSFPANAKPFAAGVSHCAYTARPSAFADQAPIEAVSSRKVLSCYTESRDFAKVTYDGHIKTVLSRVPLADPLLTRLK
jgi:hypothetical protein